MGAKKSLRDFETLRSTGVVAVGDRSSSTEGSYLDITVAPTEKEYCARIMNEFSGLSPP